MTMPYSVLYCRLKGLQTSRTDNQCRLKHPEPCCHHHVTPHLSQTERLIHLPCSTLVQQPPTPMTSTGPMRHHTAELLLCQTIPRLLGSRQRLNKHRHHSLLPHATTTSLLLIQTHREGMARPWTMAGAALMLAGATLATAGHMTMPGLLQLLGGRTMPAPMPSLCLHSPPRWQKPRRLPTGTALLVVMYAQDTTKHVLLVFCNASQLDHVSVMHNEQARLLLL